MLPRGQSGRVRRSGVAVCIALGALASALPAAASAAPGDVYVADDAYPPGSQGAVLKLPPAGGTPAVLVGGTPFSDPYGMTLGPDGLLYVADTSGTPASEGAIFRIDPATGARSTLLAGVMGGPNGFTDVAFGPDRKLYVSGSEGTDGAVYRLDPGTGFLAPIAAETAGFNGGGGIAVARDGRIYLTDFDDEVHRFDPRTGIHDTLSATPLLDGANGLAFSPDERTLYVAASQDGSGNSSPPNRLVRVDVATGVASTVATVDDAVAVALRPDRSFLLSSLTGPRGILAIGAAGFPISPFSGQPSDWHSPEDVVIEPQRCARMVPTVVGTTGKDVLRGSPFADVISTLGGKDTVNALAGDDLVCGGSGNDKLKGGAGKDRLIAGKGRKDSCVGGRGKDVAKGCEAGKP